MKKRRTSPLSSKGSEVRTGPQACRRIKPSQPAAVRHTDAFSCDETAIDLFLGGVAGWDAGLPRWIEDGEPWYLLQSSLIRTMRDKPILDALSLIAAADWCSQLIPHVIPDRVDSSFPSGIRNRRQSQLNGDTNMKPRKVPVMDRSRSHASVRTRLIALASIIACVFGLAGTTQAPDNI